MALKKKKTVSDKTAKPNKPVSVILDYYYMLTEKVSAEELMNLTELPEEKKEIWKELNLCELILSKDSLILEDAMEDFEENEDLEFLEKQGICQVYAVSFDKEDQEMALKVLESMILAKGGVLCSDTDDFHPILLGKFEHD